MSKKDDRGRLMGFEGTLETFWETGMESGLGIIVHDNRGLHEGPHYSDPSKTFMYQSHEWTIWLDKHGRYVINIFDKDDNVIYSGPLTYSREKSMKFYKEKGIDMFVPEEIDPEEWLGIVHKEYRVELFTNVFPDAIRKQYDIKYEAHQVVYDKISKNHVLISNIFVDDNDKLGYYVTSKLRKGLRRQKDLEDHRLELMEYYDFITKLRELADEEEA